MSLLCALNVRAFDGTRLNGCGAEHILQRSSHPKEKKRMPYELPPLPYDYNALEPTIDEQTMRIHHGKHHQAYVDNLNKAVEGTEFDGRPIEQLLGALLDIADDKQTAVRNNGGGHANHSLFWQIMKPGGGGEPTGDLADAINDLWDGTDALKSAMNDNGVKRFGSGWSWLVWDGTGLALYSTPNQDSPLMQDDVPLLGIDVWEHAYYLSYQNRRPDYLSAWWNVINWDEVGKRFDEARAR
jgi:Fe-Mn family superoxide dismutase